jgi:hypothetical protein
MFSVRLGIFKEQAVRWQVGFDGPDPAVYKASINAQLLFTLKMATAMFTEISDNLQHLTQLTTKCQSCTSKTTTATSY